MGGGRVGRARGQGVGGPPLAGRPSLGGQAHIRVEHEVKLGDFTKWLETKGGSPRDVIQRGKIREILGMGVGR